MACARILIVDDDESIRSSMERVLSYEGYDVRCAASGPEALDALADRRMDLALFDIKMPGMDGLELLERVGKAHPDLVCIMVSGHGTVQTAVEAAKLGAFDFLEKPPDRDRVLLTIRNGLAQSRQASEIANARRRLARDDRIVGESDAIRQVLERIAKVAPTQATILITGENGTGKELVARAIHRESTRRDGAYIQLNCAAIPEDLIESELFGHEKGAFTGATSRREGKFELADGGTILLDEIGDMSPTVQAKVLRVLEEGQFERVGGSRAISVDVRILAATNRDLPAAVEDRSFREDLFFRLNVVPIRVPALRERPGDIAGLVEHFLTRYCEREKCPGVTVDPEVVERLMVRAWPGNVRELRNTVERMAILASGSRLSVADLPAPGAGGASTRDDPAADASTYDEFRERSEQAFFRQRLERHGWNVKDTAEALAMQRSNLYRKIEKYGLTREGGERKRTPDGGDLPGGTA
ncbi:MAG: sigma-54 dependent transcriptional regulator [Gemmatimonadota bacterium]|jgi:two-component system nitrogen regulation response regulator NtrX|nr:sigma-54 dependent transcriptional regulator [Gemmatimonadota bacterium]MDP6803425.1 sigma-54 dependent transcriptional regulator [Gemmatimonadota bacterium]MDP7030938.1 sigma-54 dependent transcriptional regulator [Gemmatimonadota bacterium]